jgi:hypothetical protein
MGNPGLKVYDNSTTNVVDPTDTVAHWEDAALYIIQEAFPYFGTPVNVTIAKDYINSQTGSGCPAK